MSILAGLALFILSLLPAHASDIDFLSLSLFRLYSASKSRFPLPTFAIPPSPLRQTHSPCGNVRKHVVWASCAPATLHTSLYAFRELTSRSCSSRDIECLGGVPRRTLARRLPCRYMLCLYSGLPSLFGPSRWYRVNFLCL